MSRPILFIALLATLGSVPLAAEAQRPAGADTISDEAIADSLAVLKEIDRRLKREPRNAALWFRRGLLAWSLYDRDRVSNAGTNVVDWTLIGRIADTSLRIAKEIEPNNPLYVLTAGQYFLGTGVMTMRTQSAGMFGNALALARRANNRALIAEAALEIGRVYWRRYDAVANAGYTTADASEVRALAAALAKDTSRRSKDPERTSKTRPYTRRTVSVARRTLDRTTSNASGFPGESDYLEAERYLREAYETMPTFTRAYQQLSMLLAERGRWKELETIAIARTEIAPKEPWTWMALGLAQYRQGDVAESRESFGSAVRLLNETDRERLDHLERVLRPADTLTTSDWSASERAEKNARYWFYADPLWSVEDIDPRVEFLARLTFAELRWTVAELIKRGADTDRGAVYVRYGPPDRMATTRGNSDWSYDFSRLRFSFHAPPTYGTAYFADFGRARMVMDSIPAIWDNTHLLHIDSLPMQSARFRAGADSLDVYFATLAPVDAMRRAADVTVVPKSYFWLVDTTRTIRIRDSTRAIAPGLSTFTRRMARGDYTFRVEMGAEGSLLAARAVGAVAGNADPTTGFPLQGFGMSDVLLATQIGERAAGVSRWHGVAITPLLGPLERDAQLGLVWENYEFGDRSGSASYHVVVSIQRERARAGRIAAQVIRTLGGTVGRAVSQDRVTFKYDRTTGHAPVILDEVTLSLGGTPPGTYLLTVDVTDDVTGRTTTRTTRIIISE